MVVATEQGKGNTDANEKGKRSEGNVDQVQQQGIILYGWDGTHFRPVKVDADGRLITVTE